MRNVLCTLAALLSILVNAAASPDNSTPESPDPSIPAADSPLLPGVYVGEEWCTTRFTVDGAEPLVLTEPQCRQVEIGTDGLPVPHAAEPNPDGGSAELLDVCVSSSGVTTVRALDVPAGLVAGSGTAIATYIPSAGGLIVTGDLYVAGHYAGEPATLTITCLAILDPAD